jgi:anti-sigma regulatory factor (Ser/Thr protein kinase)
VFRAHEIRIVSSPVHPLGDLDEPAAFRHEALLYAGDDQFVEGTVTFVRDALEADAPILVVVGKTKIELLREALGADADGVEFGDMAEIGANPARIIPAWHRFLGEQTGRGRDVRGLGEPIWAGRSPAELAESQRHEALLNVAFEGSPLWLLCPYDTSSLEPDVIDAAYLSHPTIQAGGQVVASPSYAGLAALARPFEGTLPDPPDDADTFAFDGAALVELREFVSRRAAAAGMGPDHTADLELAVSELAGNSVVHASGRGTLRVWRERDEIVCEVTDSGTIDDPLAGREQPAANQVDGRGLWIANQVCSLVQIRSSAAGSVVRLRMRVP